MPVILKHGISVLPSDCRSDVYWCLRNDIAHLADLHPPKTMQ